jgi:hypothetical protein
MKARIGLSLVMCGVLTGCSTAGLEGRLVSGLVASNPDGLLQSGHRSDEHCSTEALAEVQERVRQYMHRCHRPYTTTTVSSTATCKRRVDWQVQERDSQGGGRQFFARFDHGYTLGVTVQGAGECKAAVQVFVANFGWRNRFERVISAAKGESPDCLSQ